LRLLFFFQVSIDTCNVISKMFESDAAANSNLCRNLHPRISFTASSAWQIIFISLFLILYPLSVSIFHFHNLVYDEVEQYWTKIALLSDPD